MSQWKDPPNPQYDLEKMSDDLMDLLHRVRIIEAHLGLQKFEPDPKDVRPPRKT